MTENELITPEAIDAAQKAIYDYLPGYCGELGEPAVVAALPYILEALAQRVLAHESNAWDFADTESLAEWIRNQGANDHD